MDPANVERKLAAIEEKNSSGENFDQVVSDVDITRVNSASRFLRRLTDLESWIDVKLGGIETQGVNRIPADERRPPPLSNAFLMWFSLNIHAPSMTIGYIGPELGLSLHLSIAAAIIGMVVGNIFSSFNATLGPKLGLRQVACSRYSFGMWGARLVSVLNIITIGGFLVVELIVGGSLLWAASNYNLTVIVGIIIVSVISWVISLFGYHVISAFEKYSWMLSFVLLLVCLVQAAPKVDSSVSSQGTSLQVSGAFLTMLAINTSNAIGWSTVAADYFVQYPANINRLKLGFLCYSGLIIAEAVPVLIGIVVGNVALNTTPERLEYATTYGFAGALRECFHPTGWARTALVLLSFSALGNGVAICYSAGLSLQLLGDGFRAVPRFLWSLAFIIVVAVISVAGRQDLSAAVNSLVSVIGYWSMSFCVILLLEDRVFRRKRGYHLEAWNTGKELPYGVAAVGSLIVAYCAGGVPGMAQTWYVGPIASKFGPAGGDVGMWMVNAITLIVYLPARTLERRYLGR